MRPSRILSASVAAVCIVLASRTPAFADDADRVSKATGRKDHRVARPGRPTGGPRPPDLTDAYYGGPKLDTIKEYQNALGQTVFVVTASHFDVSAPLTELAAKPLVEQEASSEENENPELPPWRRIHSDVPDPVVQPASAKGGPQGDTLAPLSPAPTTGFNFLGVGMNNLSPSDSNGSAGNNQYVETVNARYQVWSLDRLTHVATSIVGPLNINSLWAGFGGACQTQNGGDPIVVFDKVAGRWLISQFTTSPSSGVYFQCVAISTNANAAGTYNRWAFAVPGGYFGDYPHFGVWSDAYYMMAHAFTSTSGSFVAGLFAAMDRTKMLAADPSATWQVISDPTEGGHMPADLDGFAPPPTGAPGIFLSLHDTGMFVYRMKVDFTTPANTVRTKQATLPIAPFTSACGGGTCIPQPGTSVVVGSLADRLMFRAAYRNFIDHESLVVSHSVDPSVSGVVSGARWYDFRLSGKPDADCPSYPCVYQQGTFADAEGGRSRWMSSVAMDAGENILLGYSTTGKEAGTDNQSIRYTGRIKSDPPGVMTAPEAVVVTGTANNGGTRWGDYTSMSVDPIDDCTLWYVNQYYTATSNWSTRIASAAWPSGPASGQCPAAGCVNRPSSVATIGSATTPGDNQITVNWTGVLPVPGAYAIERADGVCGSEGMYKPLAAVAGTVTTYTDTTVLGGLNYAYRVIVAADAPGRCQSLVASGCTGTAATGTCNLKPAFAGATATSSANQSACGISVSWTPAVTSCPLTSNVRYNIFRGTVPDFVPAAANRIASCVPGPGSYLDTANLASGVTYYYVVRAEDSSSGNGGECNDGNEDRNTAVVSGTAYGVGTQASPGTWTDGAGDGTAFLRLNVAGPNETGEQVWRFVKVADDPGANHTPGGAYAYRNAGPTAAATYAANTCAEMQSPVLTVAAPALDLQYWERHQIEYHWDGIAVEYAVNGGAWNDVPPPSNDTGAGCAATDDTSGWETLSCTQNPAINACGYPDTKNAFNGPLASGTSCADWATGAPVPAYTHRCHPITGLTPGDAVQFRWRFTSDPGAEFAGFYLDDVAVTNVSLPNACIPDACSGQPDATPCNGGVACTTGDSCVGGACEPGSPAAAPPELTGVRVNGHVSTAVTWTSPGGPVVYDLLSSTLSDLRANGTTTASCLSNDIPLSNFDDGRVSPAAGDGYYYLVRAQSTCGTGTLGTDSAGAPRMPSPGCP